MDSSVPIRIKQATVNDTPVVLDFIRELAVYEKHLEHFEATHEHLTTHLFGANPKARVLIAYEIDKPVGFAVYYFTFSTFAGLPGIYLEDLFVKPEVRGRGVGRALLKYMARIAKAERCWRIELSVLHWNENAIRFYQNLGATSKDDWDMYRLWGDSLEQLAS